ncbi:MAG: magnesium-translocating P-type ATPase [Bacteroidetes bacterium 46-16]|nr:MAG: magnesium-translocating P-type ATPase [Bacteroidetes bacterium 46-16]
MPTDHFSDQPLNDLASQLKSSLDTGLNVDTAKERLSEQKGTSTPTSRFRREMKLFIHQFTSPLVLLLVIAVILSAILGETTDTLIILGILLVTGLLGFWQELNAGRAVEQLQKMIRLQCTIVRGGQQQEIDTNDVVPGDVLLFKAGDIIPADCRLIDNNELHVNESSITGESYPVEKVPGQVAGDAPIAEKTNCLWQGTSVVSGTGKAIAVNTGSNTVFGQMAHSLTKTAETAFETGIKKFGYFLMQITIVLSIAILAVNLYFHNPLFDSILFALAIAVGMAPELLPAIMTFAMSAGAKRMLAKKVIVKKLSSIFNFGEVDILCTDKTGTITEGAIKVKEIVDSTGKPNAEVQLYACLNANLQNGFLNPIDAAIQQVQQDISGFEKTDEVPYDFIRKRLSIAVRYKGKNLLITKGAVDNILSLCIYQKEESGTVIPIDRNRIQAFYANYCSSGFRLIGLAYKEINNAQTSKEDESEMIFLGFVVLEDPLKENIKESLARLRELTIGVKIITGDNQFVAGYVARELGIETSRIITGKDLNNMSPEALVVQAAYTDIFAEVEPYQKERIIKSLQKSHHTVAYIGDGINDVAAIHTADTGISTNNAVDVAREAADFVLLEKDLSVLADGVIEGRKTFANSLKYIFITTGATFGNMLSVAGASRLLPFLPMLPKQILLTNFLTDLPFLAVSSDNVDTDQVKRPGKWDMKMIRSFMVAFGLHSSFFDFLTFYVLYYYYHLQNSSFQTGWFVESVMTELFILFIMRTRKSFLKSVPGKWLLILGSICLLGTVWLPVSPFASGLGLVTLDLIQVCVIAVIILCYIITADLLKRIFFRWYGSTSLK